MLYAADVHVYGKIFVCLFLAYQLLAVVIVHVAQEIPGGSGPLGHGIGLSLCRCAADGAGGVHPLVNGSQRRFSGAGGLIALYLRQG